MMAKMYNVAIINCVQLTFSINTLKKCFLTDKIERRVSCICLLYTSDAADDMQCVDLGGRRIIKKEW